MSTLVTGLENFKLTEASFRRLGNREVRAFVHLHTYDLAPDVQKLPIPKRFKYMVARAERSVNGLRRRYPGLSLQERDVKLYASGIRKWSQLPGSLEYRGTVRETLGNLKVGRG